MHNLSSPAWWPWEEAPFGDISLSKLSKLWHPQILGDPMLGFLPWQPQGHFSLPQVPLVAVEIGGCDISSGSREVMLSSAETDGQKGSKIQEGSLMSNTEPCLLLSLLRDS